MGISNDAPAAVVPRSSGAATTDGAANVADAVADVADAVADVAGGEGRGCDATQAAAERHATMIVAPELGRLLMVPVLPGRALKRNAVRR